jgi:hypothetical protein
MSSPEITVVNQVRWRMAIAERRWREALELLREAAAAPGYSGPPLDVVERMLTLMSEIRGQVQNWQLDENIRYVAGLPRNTRRGNGRLRRGWPTI